MHKVECKNPHPGFELRLTFSFSTMQTIILTMPLYMTQGAHGVMVIVVGNGHGDMSSNPGPG